MLNKKNIIEFVIILESILLSLLIQIYIVIPDINNIFRIINIPISWLVPVIIILSFNFNTNLIYKAFSTYIILDLSIILIFHNGGSLGYLLSPNFVYLLGIYPLIKSIDRFKKSEQKSLFIFFKYVFIGIVLMHVIGIIYFTIKFFLLNKLNLIAYNIGKYTISKMPLQLLTLCPVILILKPLRKYLI